jgi:hypothetical protein
MHRTWSFLAASVLVAATGIPTVASGQMAALPAASAFATLKSLQGEWIDVDGAFGMKGKVAVTYRVSGGGSAIVETLFAGTPHEMVTVYTREGNDLVLTHYCSAGNQPRMRARTTDGRVVVFEFDGGANLDPAKDGHMHAGRIEFVSADRVKAEWIGWDKGAPSPHNPRFYLERKSS